MKTLISSIITSALAIGSTWATAQFPDIIMYKGEKHSMHSNPMEEYFSKHPEKKPKGGVRSTALWRGYLATFEFKDKNLVLKDIQIEIWEDKEKDTEWKSVRNRIVPDNQDLIIDWFSGILILPHGKMVNYVHMGYLSTYSDYILLEIKDGKLIEERNFKLKELEAFKKRQFEAFKNTKAYDKLVDRFIEQKVDHEEINPYIRKNILYYTDEFLAK